MERYNFVGVAPSQGDAGTAVYCNASMAGAKSEQILDFPFVSHTRWILYTHKGK